MLPFCIFMNSVHYCNSIPD